MPYPERNVIEIGREKRCRAGGRAVASMIVMRPFVWMLAVSWSGRSELAGWRFMRGCAEAALARGDLAQASLVYLQIEHVSLLQQGWQGPDRCGLRVEPARRHPARVLEAVFDPGSGRGHRVKTTKPQRDECHSRGSRHHGPWQDGIRVPGTCSLKRVRPGVRDGGGWTLI